MAKKAILIVEDRRDDETGIEQAILSALRIPRELVQISSCRSQRRAIELARELAEVRARDAGGGLWIVIADLEIFPDDEHTTNNDTHQRHGLGLLERMHKDRAAGGGLFGEWGDADAKQPYLICCTAMASPETLAEAEEHCDVRISKNDPDWKARLGRELDDNL